MPYEPANRKRIEAVSTIFQQGKIQLPACVRVSLNVKVGEKIVWVIIDGRWVVEKA